MENLDEFILEVAIANLPDKKVKVKFLAISGGCGPELVMPQSLAEELERKLYAARKERNKTT